MLVAVGLAVPGTVGAASGKVARSGSRTQRAAKLTPWEQAERGREQLEAIPEAARTKADYAHAMDGFRAVYHAAPGDVHAAASVYAVAELLAEQGRVQHDAKSLNAALGQYEFLRKQYPGSSLRVPALLAEGQIEENDLNDPRAAKEEYKLLLKKYPHSEQAEEARAGIAGLETGGRDPRAGNTAGIKQQEAGGGGPGAGASGASGAGLVARGSSAGNGIEARANLPGNKAASQEGKAGVTASHAPPVQGAIVTNAAANDAAIPSPLDGGALPAEAKQGGGDASAAERRHGPLAQVTGIRHWSTATYTRVAIDLGDDVTFQAARVPNPDRIYFDLHGTRLAQELVGKNFTVTDNGFLTKIRAAQFSNDMTRVVLDVNDVTEYSAFLLPNPYRLIIDIHGGAKAQGAGSRSLASGSGGGAGNALQAEAPAPRTATAGRESAGRPVPNTISTRSASTTDIASLSDEPGRVAATSQPTSQPISAVVTEKAPGSKDQGTAGAAQGGQTIAAPSGDAASGSAGATAGASSGAATGGVASGGAVSGGAGPASAKKRARSKASAADGASATDALPARAAVPTADGETSLVRTLGLKIGRIVIDPGHGGHDSGTLGAGGIQEKDVVLDVALRLGKLLHERLGAEIIYTRSDDTFIPLETRTAIANKAQADLFLSIHANSSSDPTARGVESYYLNFTSSPDALETAARENAVSTESIHQLSDLVKKITLKDKIDESREFASDVQQGLYGGLVKDNVGLKNRGVKKAPFVVLIGANMPSVLAEISFVTNPKDADQLRQPEYRERVAESLYKGVAKYEAGLSGLKTPTLRASAAGAN